MNNPRGYGVPHDTWRPNQFAMYREVENVIRRGGGFIFGELGTGSGKSAIATAMGSQDKVLVVVHTLSLLDQYRDMYGFSIIKGRQEYPCVHKEKVDSWKTLNIEPTAADCTYSPMHSCEYADECPYLIAKHIAVNAQRAACTYRYIAVSGLMQRREGNIVFDEAHDAAEELIRFNKFEYKHAVLKKWRLPPFPITTYGLDGRGATLEEGGVNLISTWIVACLETMNPNMVDNDGQEGTRLKRIMDRFQRTLESMKEYQWFLKVDRQGFSLQALSAAPIAKKVFMNKSTKLLMSATIGNPQPLATALGIDDYETLSFEHPVPARKRPVFDLGVPNMTARNIAQDKDLFKKQGRAIWNWIQSMPPNWRGVILTSSYKKIEEIYQHLIVPNNISPNKRRIRRQRPGMKVGDLVADFLADRKPGDIMIGTIQGWGSGLDLNGEIARWLIVAGVPHKNPTDQYMKARRAIAGGAQYERWTVYNAVMQAAGRVSRGEIDEIDEWIPNYVAIADGSALTKTARKYFGQWFTDAIRKHETE